MRWSKNGFAIGQPLTIGMTSLRRRSEVKAVRSPAGHVRSLGPIGILPEAQPAVFFHRLILGDRLGRQAHGLVEREFDPRPFVWVVRLGLLRLTRGASESRCAERGRLPALVDTSG